MAILIGLTALSLGLAAAKPVLPCSGSTYLVFTVAAYAAVKEVEYYSPECKDPPERQVDSILLDSLCLCQVFEGHFLPLVELYITVASL
jgi:hypothetical protein